MEMGRKKTFFKNSVIVSLSVKVKIIVLCLYLIIFFLSFFLLLFLFRSERYEKYSKESKKSIIQPITNSKKSVPKKKEKSKCAKLRAFYDSWNNILLLTKLPNLTEEELG